MKRRPDWIGDAQRGEKLAALRKRRQEQKREKQQKRGGKKFWETMTPEEREKLRVDLLEAHDTVSALVAEMSTPEARAEAERCRAEFKKVIGDMNTALTDAESALSERFGKVEASVPAYDRNGDEFWVYFDGEHLFWHEAPNSPRWLPLRHASLRIRTAIPDALHLLLSALKGRRWIYGDVT